MPYLFGTRPSLADFSLAGPICGHLRYDEAAKRRWLQPRPHLLAWSERMASGERRPAGEFLRDDFIPETLRPMLASVFGEMVPFLQATIEQVRSMSHRRGAHLPRFSGLVRFPLAGQTFSRQGIPYTLWMAQRVQGVLADLPPSQAEEVRRWVKSLGGDGFLQLHIPRLSRVGVHAALK